MGGEKRALVGVQRRHRVVSAWVHFSLAVLEMIKARWQLLFCETSHLSMARHASRVLLEM